MLSASLTFCPVRPCDARSSVRRELGNTMAKIGIKPEDTRDEGKHERFHVLSIMDERKSMRKIEPEYWCGGLAAGLSHCHGL